MESIWSKIDPSLVQAPAEVAQDADTVAKAEEARKTWRWVRPILDLFGTAFWLYALLKLFVVDIDREILEISRSTGSSSFWLSPPFSCCRSGKHGR